MKKDLLDGRERLSRERPADAMVWRLFQTCIFFDEPSCMVVACERARRPSVQRGRRLKVATAYGFIEKAKMHCAVSNLFSIKISVDTTVLSAQLG